MTSEIMAGHLYIGDADDGRNAHKDLVEYDRVIAMASGDHDNATDTFEIPDGGWKFTPQEHYPIFSEAVNTLRRALRENETVLIHCNAGQSRAPAVAIAALAVEKDMTFNETYNRVQDKRSIVNLSPELRYCAKEYIESRVGGER